METAPARILLVHNSADLYGASRSLLRLVRTLDRARYAPVVMLPEYGPLVELLHCSGAEVTIHSGVKVIDRYVIKSWRVILLLFSLPIAVVRLARWIKLHNIHLVHSNTGVLLSPAPAAWLAGRPHVWHIRDWFQEFRGLWGPYSRMIICLSQRVVAVSEAIAGQFPDRRRVVVLHNGFSVAEFAVPYEAYRTAFRQRWGVDEEPVIGCVGRIKLVRKGQEHLVRAAAELKRRGRRFKLVIVGTVFPGNESHLDTLKRLVEELKVEDRVVFTGEIADPRTVYPGLDILVLPSAQPEPFGGVVMEAMCLGLPVVATDLGGSRDQVVAGETGFLVPPADSQALTKALQQLLDDPECRQRMGAAGRRRIKTHFRLEDRVRDLEKIYAELLGKTDFPKSTDRPEHLQHES